MSVPTKPCASCGSPVADSALGRGAVEDAEGRRYCSPCAAKVKDGEGPEAEAVRVVYPRPSSAVIPAVQRQPDPPPAPPAAPAASPARKSAAQRAARRETSRRAPARKKTGAKRAPARKNSSSRVKPAPARKDSSSRTKPARRRDSRRIEPAPVGEATSSTRRVSRRSSSREALPWYFNITRGQWIGIASGGGVLLILLLIVCVAAAGGDREAHAPIQRNPVPYGGNPSKAIAAAERLVRQGKKQEAIKLLEEAKQQARKNRQEGLVLEINRKLYGLRYKTAH